MRKILLSLVCGVALTLIVSFGVSQLLYGHYDPIASCPPVNVELCDPSPFTPFGIPFQFGYRDSGYAGGSNILTSIKDKFMFALDIAAWSTAAFVTITFIQKRHKSAPKKA